jgi:hypothetical protein
MHLPRSAIVIGHGVRAGKAVSEVVKLCEAVALDATGVPLPTEFK